MLRGDSDATHLLFNTLFLSLAQRCFRAAWHILPSLWN